MVFLQRDTLDPVPFTDISGNQRLVASMALSFLDLPTGECQEIWCSVPDTSNFRNLSSVL